MESTFGIIAEPNRRAILSLLALSERSVGEIELQLRMPQPSVSKHLKVLRDAGFVEARINAQQRVYRIRAEPLRELDEWLAPFRRFWSSHVDALQRQLDRIDQRTDGGTDDSMDQRTNEGTVEGTDQRTNKAMNQRPDQGTHQRTAQSPPTKSRKRTSK